MNFRILLLALTATTLVGVAGAAQATVFSGSGTFSDNGPAGNGLIFTGDSANGAITNVTLTLGTPYVVNDFLTIHSHDVNDALFGVAGASDKISESFTFTLPSSGSGTVSGTGEEATFAFFGVITGASGQITWSNPGVVTFTDGAVLDVTLSDPSFDVTGPFVNPNQIVDVDATFEMVTAPTAVPEPASLGLLGVGLAALGLIRRRTRSA